MYKVLVVGLGNIGMCYDTDNDSKENILSHSKAFNWHDEFILVAGVDPNLEKCMTFKLTFGCESFTNLEDALYLKKPDIIVISTPTETHYEIINNILNKFVPFAILCEKPISYNFNEAKKIVEKCEKLNCKLYINYMRRSDVGVQEIIKRITNNNIKLPVRGVVFYCKGIYNSGSHFINLLQYFFGEPVKIINDGVNNLNKKIDPEPDFQIIFQKANIKFLAIDTENYFYNSMELFFKNGRLRYDYGGEKILWYNSIKKKDKSSHQILSFTSEQLKSEFKKIQFNLVNEMAKSLKGLPANICSGYEGLKTLEIIEKIRIK